MPRWTEKRWFRWARDLGLVLLVYVGIRTYRTWDAPSGEAPTVHAALLDGGQLDLTRYRGSPVLLHFWATWCGVCRAEQHNIVALADDLPVVTVASQSGDADAVRTYVEQQDLRFPVALDPDGQVAARFGVSAYPTSFVLDGDGAIRSIEPGYTTELGLRLRMWWASL